MARLVCVLIHDEDDKVVYAFLSIVGDGQEDRGERFS